MVWFLLNGAFVWVWLCKLMTNLWQTYDKLMTNLQKNLWQLVTVNKLINHISAILIITKQHRMRNEIEVEIKQLNRYVCLLFSLTFVFLFSLFCMCLCCYVCICICSCHTVCNDICFFVCWCLLVFVCRSGLVPLDADNLCLIIQL